MDFVACGVHGYFVEESYLFTHLNMRGLVSWDFRPLPDGRFDAVREIAADSEKLADFIREARILAPDEASAIGVSLTATSKRLHLRMRSMANGDHFALVINEDLAMAASARLTVAEGKAYRVTDVLSGRDRGLFDSARHLATTATPGGAVVLKLKSSSRP